MALAAIYVGRGTSALSIRGARAMLEERGVEVILVTAKELPKTLQDPNCRLLVTNLDVTSKVEVGIQVMPGGRDRPYQASLGEEGARRIRQFVEQGGSYLGLCAGAYFASARVLFQPGTDMEVDEQRPLAFFPGTAWGAVTGPEFKYSSEAGTAGVNLGSDLIVYYNGGCSFKGEEEVFGDCKVEASYEEVEGRPPAVLSRTLAEGRVILSGVHWEISANMAQEEGTEARVVKRLQVGETQRKRFAEKMMKYLLQSDPCESGIKDF